MTTDTATDSGVFKIWLYRCNDDNLMLLGHLNNFLSPVAKGPVYNLGSKDTVPIQQPTCRGQT